MPEGSKWLGDVLAGVAFLLGVTIYGLRMIPSTAPPEPPQIPVQWGQGGPIIGIDIGTTYSRAGLVVSNNRVKIFHDANHCFAEEESFLPSAFLWPNTGGESALPATPIRDEDAFEAPCSSLDKIAATLHKLRTIAQNFHGGPISRAVITIPADYSAEQRKMIKDAALIAGLSPVRLLDQPVAIAMAYGLDRLKKDSIVFVMDVGASTRAALLHVNNTDSEIVASARNVGGSAISNVLFDYATDTFRSAFNDHLNEVQRAVLEDQVEQAKAQLSFENLAVIAVPIQDAPWFLVPVTAAELNTRTAELVEDIVDGTIEQVLRTAGVFIRAIDHLILTGGSAHTSSIRDRVARAFPSVIPLSTTESYPEDAVVYGAALFARRLALGMVPKESKISMQNATPLRFGVEIAGGLFATIISRNSPLPARMTRRLTIPGRVVRIFTGVAEYTNATEFIGSMILPPQMNTTRMKITLDLSVYGILNVTVADWLGRSRSILMEPRPPSAAEIARMEAEAAAQAEREDVTQRIQTFRTYIAHYRPILSRQLGRLAADHPQHAVRTQIVDAMAAIDAWMAKHMRSASREQFFGKLAELETLLREDVGLQTDFPGGATRAERH